MPKFVLKKKLPRDCLQVVETADSNSSGHSSPGSSLVHPDLPIANLHHYLCRYLPALQGESKKKLYTPKINHNKIQNVMLLVITVIP